MKTDLVTGQKGCSPLRPVGVHANTVDVHASSVDVHASSVDAHASSVDVHASSVDAPATPGNVSGSRREAPATGKNSPKTATATVGSGNSAPLSLLFAIPGHPWVDTAEGAAVRIAMTVGAAGNHPGELRISTAEEPHADGSSLVTFTVKTGRIAADLTTGADVSGAVALRANDTISTVNCANQSDRSAERARITVRPGCAASRPLACWSYGYSPVGRMPRGRIAGTGCDPFWQSHRINHMRG